MRVQPFEPSYLPQLLELVNLHLGAVALPGRGDAATELLSAARERLANWKLRREYGWISGLPTVPIIGVPESWPHVAATLEAAGYRPDPRHHREALYGGRLDCVPDPTEEPPVPGLTVRRTLGPWGTRFSAVAGGEEVGFCEIAPELTRGGLLPALRGWVELQELWVLEGWRDRGIGGHLVRHAVAWLRLAGCDRIVFNVASSAEAAGAGRFYRRFGWEVIVREVGSNTTVSAGPGSEKS